MAASNARPPASQASPAAGQPARPAGPFRAVLRQRLFETVLPLLALVCVVGGWASVAPGRMGQWGAVKTVIFSIPFVLALVLVGIFAHALGAWRRIRRDWVRNNPDDPTCKNLLMVYDLSRKALYFPTIVTSVVMSVLMFLKQRWGLLGDVEPTLLGGIWLGVFFVNFLVEEYDIDLRALIITVVVLAGAFMWVAVMNWIPEFFRFFERFGIAIDAAGYALIASVFILAILYSVFKGTFHYVEITPNYLNIQMGLAETGEQLSREQYSTRIEAEDLIERLLGFGRLIITFRDTRRAPMVFLVHGVGRKAAQLEGIRGTYLVDQQDPTRGA
ncbi:MAG TPA: hypothetical protein P5532_13050 [Planctomycetota bacterium]|nr:hypothetical protein [Planctomycetota bacterium]HRT95349.1 hypothetical protein [Planctomycetota bacterium]